MDDNLERQMAQRYEMLVQQEQQLQAVWEDLQKQTVLVRAQLDSTMGARQELEHWMEQMGLTEEDVQRIRREMQMEQAEAEGRVVDLTGVDLEELTREAVAAGAIEPRQSWEPGQLEQILEEGGKGRAEGTEDH